MPCHAQSIVGVHLDRQVITGVDELDQKREATSEALEYALPYEALAVGLDKFVEAFACELAFGYHRVIIIDMGDLPALSDLLLVRLQALEWTDGLTAPDDFLEKRSEGQRIKALYRHANGWLYG